MKKIFFGLALLTLLLAGCRINRPGVAGFYVNDPGGFDSFPSLEIHQRIIDAVYPLWYHVHPDGSVQDKRSAQPGYGFT